MRGPAHYFRGALLVAGVCSMSYGVSGDGIAWGWLAAGAVALGAYNGLGER